MCGDLMQCVCVWGGLSRGWVEDVTWVRDVTGLVGRDPDVHAGHHVVCAGLYVSVGMTRGCVAMSRGLWSVTRMCGRS